MIAELTPGELKEFQRRADNGNQLSNKDFRKLMAHVVVITDRIAT